MQPRIDYHKDAPAGAFNAMYALEAYVRSCGLEHSLLELVKTRASQINGCAYCIDMHTKDARAEGESEQRLYALSAWRETPLYSDRERAALEWTEALTLIHTSHVADEVYERVREHFTAEELVKLSLAVVTINGWNRLAISFRSVPGSYQRTAQRGCLNAAQLMGIQYVVDARDPSSVSLERGYDRSTVDPDNQARL
jgi:AhpD family alkylhydroperoxidase